MAQKYVGIDLGNHRIKGVVVSAGIRGTQVVDAFTEVVGTPPQAEQPEAPTTGEDDKTEVAPAPEAPKKPDHLAHALSVTLRALRQRNLLGTTVALCLPPGLLSYRLLDFPFNDERRIAATIGFEADGQFPVSMDQLVHGHVVVPKSGEGGRALMVAARRDKVEQVTTLFDRAGTDVKLMTSPAIAAAQVTKVDLPAAIGPDHPQPVALLVDLGHTSTHFIAVGPKGPLAVRTLRRGGSQLTRAIASAYRLDFDDAEAAKHADAFLPHRGFSDINEEQLSAGRMVASAFESIVRELEHTRLWLRATYNLDVVKVIPIGGGAALQGVAPYIGEQTGLVIESFAPGASGLKAAGNADWASLANALGAAYGAARRPLVQLRNDGGPEGSSNWLQEKMSSLIAIGVAVLAFGALDSISQVRAAEAQLAAYQDELDQETLKTFGQKLGPKEVEKTLKKAEGADLTELIPDRGALEVLAMITKSATPSDLGSAPPPAITGGPGATAPGGGIDPPGSTSASSGSDGDKKDEDAAATPAPIGPISADAGVVMADGLAFSGVQIREKRLELKVVANIASAQDRLARELTKLGCIDKIVKGRVRGDAQKTFEMQMDSTCYEKRKAAEEEEESDEDEDAEEEEE